MLHRPNRLLSPQPSGPGAPLDIARLDEGTYLSQGGQIRSWIYWSRVTLAANTNSIVMFQQKQGADLSLTNMPDVGKIPNSQRFDIKAISVIQAAQAPFASDNPTVEFNAWQRWALTTQLSINIQDLTVRFQAPLAVLMGRTSIATMDSSNVEVVTTDRSPEVQAYRLERKITVTANTTFDVTLNPSVAAAAGDQILVGLHGDLWSRS